MEYIKQQSPDASPVPVSDDTPSRVDSSPDSMESVRHRVAVSDLTGMASDQSEAFAGQANDKDDNPQSDLETSSEAVGEEVPAIDWQRDFDLHHARIQAQIQQMLHPDLPSDAEVLETRSESAGDSPKASPDHAARSTSSSSTGNALSGKVAEVSSSLNATELSSQAVLQGLMRDRHHGTMSFTLRDPRFSLEDLLTGLEEAYVALQMATAQLAALATLVDDVEGMSATELHKWIVRFDQLDPQTRYEPKLPDFCNSLPRDVVQTALEEVVQSRVEVEDETRRMTGHLMGRMEKLEAHCRYQAWVAEMRNEQSKDNWVTFVIVMVMVIGALYLCVS